MKSEVLRETLVACPSWLAGSNPPSFQSHNRLEKRNERDHAATAAATINPAKAAVTTGGPRPRASRPLLLAVEVGHLRFGIARAGGGVGRDRLGQRGQMRRRQL